MKIRTEKTPKVKTLIESGESLKYEMRLPADYLAGILIPHIN
jgi:hypothetical protein